MFGVNKELSLIGKVNIWVGELGSAAAPGSMRFDTPDTSNSNRCSIRMLRFETEVRSRPIIVYCGIH